MTGKVGVRVGVGIVKMVVVEVMAMSVVIGMAVLALSG